MPLPFHLFFRWPSWQGNLVETNIPCPGCGNSKTMNWAGTLDPEGFCGYMCNEYNLNFDIPNYDQTLFSKDGRKTWGKRFTLKSRFELLKNGA